MAGATTVGGGVDAAPGLGWRLIQAVAKSYVAEGERRLLWLPVFFGAGIGIYFSLTFEPPLWCGIGGTILAGSLTFALYRRPLACEAALGITLLCAGFALIGENQLGALGADLAAPSRAGLVFRARSGYRLGR